MALEEDSAAAAVDAVRRALPPSPLSAHGISDDSNQAVRGVPFKGGAPTILEAGGKVPFPALPAAGAKEGGEQGGEATARAA
jgi:hypothetical protein